jgi:hypothetical protein
MNIDAVRVANAYKNSISKNTSSQAPTEARQTEPAPVDAQVSGEPNSTVLSQEEYQYFEQLYPNETSHIRSYQTYRQDGSNVTAGTGTLVDRKG